MQHAKIKATIGVFVLQLSYHDNCRIIQNSIRLLTRLRTQKKKHIHTHIKFSYRIISTLTRTHIHTQTTSCIR